MAGIGDVLRHDYESIAAPVMWKLVQDDLPPLEKVCREELAREQPGSGEGAGVGTCWRSKHRTPEGRRS